MTNLVHIYDYVKQWINWPYFPDAVEIVLSTKHVQKIGLLEMPDMVYFTC